MTEATPRVAGGEGGRLPPHNLEAERSALGALLLDVHAASPALQLLSEEDFYLRPHQLIYRVVCDLYDRLSSADIVLAGEALTRLGELEKIGGEAYLLRLAEEVPSAANALFYAQLVRDTSIRRQLVRSCTGIIREAYEGKGEAREQLDRAEQAIFDIASEKGTTQFVPLHDIIDPVFDILDKDHKGPSGLPTGFTKFDELTNGFHPAELIVVAGRPSMGKTTFAVNVARHAAFDLGKSVGIFSLEVSRLQVVLNLMCSHGRVDAHRVRSGTLSPRQWQDLIDTADRMREASFHIDDSGVLNTIEAKAKARRLKARYGLDLLIFDYLQLMSHSGAESRQGEISAISRGLKALARELDVPIIAISQLSRAVESREQHRPRLSDLRESGAIEQDADVVVLLYREEYYHKDKPEAKGKAEAIIAKQRNGPTGTVHLTFLGHIMRFENQAQTTESGF